MRAKTPAWALLAGLFWAGGANAQLLNVGGEDPNRDPYESPQNFALELRGGPFRPNVDDEFQGGVQPFHDIFGDAPRVMLGLEFDWQVLRLRYVGTLGLGAALSYASFTRPAPQTVAGRTDLTRPSGQDTDFTVMPMYAVAVLRVDALARYTPVPLVPYAKLGFGYTAWWVAWACTSPRA